LGTGAATAGDAGNADDAGNVDDADDAGDDVVVTAAADVASFWFKGRRRRTRGEGELFAVNTCHSQRNNNNNNYNNYNYSNETNDCKSSNNKFNNDNKSPLIIDKLYFVADYCCCCTVCTALLFSYSAIFIAASVRNKLIHQTVSWTQTKVVVSCALPTQGHVSSDGPTAVVETRCLAAAVPQPWNSLSAHLRQTVINFEQFQRLLKTFLFGCRDHDAL